MVSEHPSFAQPTNPNIKLWRYMDLAKFVAILQTRSLYFSRADKLGDPFEGSSTRMHVLFGELMIAAKNTGVKVDDFWDSSTPEQIRQMFSSMSEHRRKATEEHYVSCWHMNEEESAAMWKLYSSSGEAVCIQTTYKTLYDLLPSWSHLGLVTYINYDAETFDANNGFNAFLHKRRSFEHEREVRAIAWDRLSPQLGGAEINANKQAGGLPVDVEINELIKSVHISPDAAPWFLKVVIEICQKYDLPAPVLQSSLSASPLF